MIQPNDQNPRLTLTQEGASMGPNMSTSLTPNAGDMGVRSVNGGIELAFTHGHYGLTDTGAHKLLAFLLAAYAGQLQILAHIKVGRIEVTNFQGYLKIETPKEIEQLNKSELPKFIKSLQRQTQ